MQTTSVSLQDPLLSIVVPIYNTSQFLDECLASILAQTYQNWEALLINDASTDQSATICKAWVKKDARFKYHVLPRNGGLSEVRRCGMDLAIGDVIGSVDSDDFLLPNHFETMIETMLDHDADIVLCGFRKTYGDGRFRKNALNMPEGFTWVHPDLLIEAYIDKRITGSIPNKIFRRGILEKDDFPTGRMLYEDYAAIIHPIVRAKRATHTGLCTYCYRLVGSSITHSKTFKHYHDFCVLASERYQYLDLCEKKGLITAELKEKLLIFPKKAILEHFYYAMQRASTPDEKEQVALLGMQIQTLGLLPILRGFHVKMMWMSLHKRITEHRLRHLQSEFLK